MEKHVRGWTLGELAERLDGTLHGPSDLHITGPAASGSGDANSLGFAGNDSFIADAEKSAIGAVLVRRGATCDKPYICVDDPKRSFAEFLALVARDLPHRMGAHPTAVIDPRSRIHPTASIGAFAVIEENVTVGPGCRIYPFCYVGDGCSLADDVVLYPHVVLYQDISIGARTVIHGGTVLGADGFGYQWDGSHHLKMPQVGGVTIGSDCEIGALTAVDRAMIGTTSIGKGTKIDNLVQIAHNDQIGDHVILASQVGVGGSTVIGDRSVLAGQAGVGDHVTLVEGITLAARTATTENLDEPGIYKGFPPQKLSVEQRQIVHVRRLPDMAKKLKELEKRIAELESRKEC